MTTQTATSVDYGDALRSLNGRSSRKLANNTYARLESDGRVVIRYHATDILTFDPDGTVTYATGGWLTYSTKERLNSFGARGVRITQSAGRWFVYIGREVASDFYDGLRVRDGVVLDPVHSGDPDSGIKKAIDRYVKGYTDEELTRLIETSGTGDCLYCQMRVAGTGDPGIALGEHTGDHEHLRDHIEENYRMVNLAYNAVQAAGYINPAVILRHGDLTRRAIRRYLRQRLATRTAGAAGGSKPVAEHWAG